MVTCGVRACMVPGHRQLVLRSVAFILRVPPSTQMPLGDRVQGPTGSFTRARALCPNSGVSTWKKGVFTSVPSENGCLGSKCKHSLGASFSYRLIREYACYAVNSRCFQQVYTTNLLNPAIHG